MTGAGKGRKADSVPAATLRRGLLGWYDRHRRALPWRAAPGERPDPYRVWLSEVMLQQTTVATVAPYFSAFLERWPSVGALAVADLDAVLHGWAGLGYYARARNLHRAARVVSGELGGRFPDDEAALLRLPGVGAYTAAAIAAIAFDRPAMPVDGNVERVIARLFGVATPLPAARTELVRRARALAPTGSTGRPGDFAQAMMDLGATVCTPRKAACALCPWRDPCIARAAGMVDELPRRAARAEKPTRRGVAFWAVRGDGAVLLRRRPEKGLLGGMMEVPSTEWREGSWSEAQALRAAPVVGDWRGLPGLVSHTFTHFHLEIEVMAAQVNAACAEGVWCAVERLGDYALPTVMKKVAAHAMKATLVHHRRLRFT